MNNKLKKKILSIVVFIVALALIAIGIALPLIGWNKNLIAIEQFNQCLRDCFLGCAPLCSRSEMDLANNLQIVWTLVGLVIVTIGGWVFILALSRGPKDAIEIASAPVAAV